MVNNGGSPTNNSQGGPGAKPLDEVQQTLEAHVVAADGSGGEHSLRIRMLLHTTFGKMMEAWCKHHNVALIDARFTLTSGRELQPTDTPEFVGLGITSSPVTIRATPRNNVLMQDAVPSGSPKAVQKAAGTAGVAKANKSGKKPSIAPEASAPGAARAPGAAASALVVDSSDSESDQLAVDAPSDDGESTDVSESSVEVPPAAARRRLLGSAGARAASSKRRRLSSDESGAEEGEIGNLEKGRIAFRVIAECEANERHELRFTMASDTPFLRLMMSWCRHHSLHPDAARFVIGDRELTEKDTPFGLAVASVIPEHLVGVTPSMPDGAGPDASEEVDEEVEVRAMPRRLRATGAPPRRAAPA